MSNFSNLLADNIILCRVYILVQFFRNLIIKSVNVEDQFMSEFTLIRHGTEGALQNHETEDQEKRGKTEGMVERLENLVK